MQQEEALSVFVVEDDPVYASVLKYDLEVDPIISVEIFHTGEDCIRHLSEKPDVVLVDFSLKGKANGLDVLKEVKSMNEATEVIFLSSQEKIEVAIDSMKYGALDYIIKNDSAFPKIKELVKRINTFRQIKDDHDKYTEADVNILLVDDVETNLYLLEKLLEGKGRTIYKAISGKEALGMTLKYPFALILLDVQMPEMNGFEVARVLKSNSKTKNIPIVFVTAANDEEFLLKGMETGAIDYLYKPLNPQITKSKADAFVKLYSYQRAIEEQNVKLHLQKAIIQEKNQDITASITYASRIQKAILPDENQYEKLFPQSFVLYKPRDIVSGDFHWAQQVSPDIVIWAAVDCTGHGVPGAFMSMIGNTLLHEIVIEKKIWEADKILNQLRDKIISALSQTGQFGEQKDGMDMALCVWNKKTNKLQFSGAQNPLYLFKKNKIDVVANDWIPFGDASNGFEIKADRYPISYLSFEQAPFTKKEIDLNKGDTLYIFSDGYADQFGGPLGKKFKFRQFKQLLSSIQHLKMDKQKEMLNETLEDWRGSTPQVDDVLLIGIKV